MIAVSHFYSISRRPARNGLGCRSQPQKMHLHNLTSCKRLGPSEPCCLDITGVMKSPQAVIGSAPQLVPHFILAAAHLYTGMIRYLLLLVVQCMHMHTSVSAPIAVTRYCVHFDHAPTSRCTIGACAHVRLGTVWSYLSNCASRILGATRPCSLLVLMHLVPRLRSHRH